MVPKEHGAWAMLLVPFAVGAAVSRQFGVAVPLFLIACLSLFMARYPLSLYWKGIGKRGRDEEGRRLLTWLAVYSLTGLAALALLVAITSRALIIPLAAPLVLLLPLHLYMQRRRVERSIWGQLMTIAGLAWVAPMSYYAAGGRFDSTAVVLWVLTFLYSGASVFYVKLKVRQRSAAGGGGRWEQARSLASYMVFVAAALILLVVLQATPLLAPLAFVPLFYKAASASLAPKAAKSIREIGFVELGHSILFTILLVAAYLLLPGNAALTGLPAVIQ